MACSGFSRSLSASLLPNTPLRLAPKPMSFVSCCYSPEGGEKELRQVRRREIVLRSNELAVLAAIFHFSGTKPSYLGVQKSPPSLALCPATKNCVSTSEDAGDFAHYSPPWNYNPEDGRGKNQPVSREVAMDELLQVVFCYASFAIQSNAKLLPYLKGNAALLVINLASLVLHIAHDLKLT